MDKKKVAVIVMFVCFVVALCITAPFRASIVGAEENYKTAYIAKNLNNYKMLEFHFPIVNKDFLIFLDNISKEGYFFIEVEKRNKYVSNLEGMEIRNFPNIKYDNIEKIIPYGTKVQLFGKIKEWEVLKIKDKYYFCLDEDLSCNEPVSIKNNSEVLYTPNQLKTLGVIYWGGWRWTWYSQKVLPGGGLNIPGRHVDKNDYICDKDDYICLASSKLAKGTIVSTPFGKMGKIYDSGCAPDTLDVYVNF